MLSSGHTWFARSLRGNGPADWVWALQRCSRPQDAASLSSGVTLGGAGLCLLWSLSCRCRAVLSPPLPHVGPGRPGVVFSGLVVPAAALVLGRCGLVCGAHALPLP